MMLDLYLHAELALSRHNQKEKEEEIYSQKIGGHRSHIVYIGHNPHAPVSAWPAVSVFSLPPSLLLQCLYRYS